MSARIDVGECIDAERGCVRCHVQAVGQQRHRAEQEACDDLDDHHRGRDRYDDESLGFARPLLVLPERMRMLPARLYFVVHAETLAVKLDIEKQSGSARSGPWP